MYSNTRTTMQTGGRTPHNNNKLQRKADAKHGCSGSGKHTNRTRRTNDFSKGAGAKGGGRRTGQVRKRRRRRRVGRSANVARSRGGCGCEGNGKGKSCVGGGEGCEWLVAVARTYSRTRKCRKRPGVRESGRPPTPSNNSGCATGCRQNSMSEVAKLARMAHIKSGPCPSLALSQRPMRHTPRRCQRDLPWLPSHGPRRGKGLPVGW